MESSVLSVRHIPELTVTDDEVAFATKDKTQTVRSVCKQFSMQKKLLDPEFSSIMRKSWQSQSPSAVTASVAALQWLRHFKTSQLFNQGIKISSAWRSALLPKHGLVEAPDGKSQWVVLVPGQWSTIAWKAKQEHQ